MRQEHRSQTHISLIPDHSPYDLLFPNFFYISISRSLNGSRQVFRSQFSLLTLVPTPKVMDLRLLKSKPLFYHFESHLF
ncbi:hypothetical protein HA466_0105310 [Hirschfeldia incana]|nr:hypothetical protein HA466_0105310 [Hirschfeldia incana]